MQLLIIYSTFFSARAKKYMGSLETVHSRNSASTKNNNNNDKALKERGCNVFVIVVGLVMFQQLCGANLITLHAEHVFSEYGSMDDTSIKTRIIVIVVALAQVRRTGAVVSFRFTDIHHHWITANCRCYCVWSRSNWSNSRVAESC